MVLAESQDLKTPPKSILDLSAHAGQLTRVLQEILPEDEGRQWWMAESSRWSFPFHRSSHRADGQETPCTAMPMPTSHVSYRTSFGARSRTDPRSTDKGASGTKRNALSSRFTTTARECRGHRVSWGTALGRGYRWGVYADQTSAQA